MTLAFLCIAWLAGNYAGSFYSIPPPVFLAGLIPLFFYPVFARRKYTLLLIAFCLTACLGAGVRYNASLPVLDGNHISFFNDNPPVQFEAVITSDPEVRDRSLRFQVSRIKTIQGERETNFQGNVLIRAQRYPELGYGDSIRIQGKLETPPSFDGFDYREYLFRHNIFSVINYPRIEVIKRESDSNLTSTLYSFRRQLSDNLAKILPEPQCAVAQGVLLGVRSGIPASLGNAFARTGTSHVLAISGLNLNILLGIVLSLGTMIFGRRYYIYIVIALTVIWFYALITGLSAPVVRSAIMGSVFLFAEILGRQRSAFTALTFAATVMVVIEPQIMWDISFQLSFVSMLGLIFIYPGLSNWARKWAAERFDSNGALTSIINWAIDCSAVTLAAILSTLPIIAHNFGTFSLISLPSNVLVLPVMPAMIILTALTALADLLSPVLAFLFAQADWLFISYFVSMVQFLGSFSLAAVNVAALQAWQIASYYGILVAGIIILHNRKGTIKLTTDIKQVLARMLNSIAAFIIRFPKKWLVIPSAVIAILVCIAVVTLPDKYLHVSVLDVGQGESILIQTPSHQKILIDGGPSPQALKLALGKKLPFWDRAIDLVIVTQPQSDHLTGLLEICRIFKVKKVFDTGIKSESNIFAQWLTTLDSYKIPYNAIYRGQRINIGDKLHMDVLNPPPRQNGSEKVDINDYSLVLRLVYEQVSFLFTADVSSMVEDYLIAEQDHLNSTVLKIAHHGSRQSTSSRFLANVKPDAAAISAGKGNVFGHPDPEVIKRLTAILERRNTFVTADNGTIEFITDGHKMWVKTER